jgi:8-oxo-dGTP diphosphatase
MAPQAPKFCSACSASLREEEVDGRIRQVCGSCGKIHYVNPLPVASSILLNDAREVLLVKRLNEPSKGEWCLPVGFAETGETIQEAALRELLEETGVVGEVLALVDAGSEVNPFYGDMLFLTFAVKKIGGLERAGDDAAEVRYFPLSALPPLAFPTQDATLGRFSARGARRELAD